MEGEWLSVSAAAKRMGISRQALQFRIKKGQCQSRDDNMGRPQVWLPALAIANGAKPDANTPSAESASPPPTEARQIAAGEQESIPLSVHRETLEAIQRANAELLAGIRSDAHRAIAAERRRCDVLEARLAAPLRLIERLIGRHVVVSEESGR